MDRQSVFSTHVYDATFAQGEDTNLQVQAQLEAFILDFRLDNVFVYRDQLRENALLQKYYCDVNIGDLIKFNEEIAHRLVNEPADIIPLVRAPGVLRPGVDLCDTLLTSCLVRGCPEKMYTQNRLSTPGQGRPTGPPAPPALECRRCVDPESRLSHYLPAGPGAWYRHRCLGYVFQGH